jgi:hypothetical protein
LNKTRKKLISVVIVLGLSTLACTIYSIADSELVCAAIGGMWDPGYEDFDGFWVAGECRKPYLEYEIVSEPVDENESEPAVENEEPVDENADEPVDEILSKPDSPPVVENEEPSIEENEDDIVVEPDPLSMTWEG